MNRTLLLFLFLIPVLTSAQDVHFSHIHATPTLLNPGMTGLFDGDVRFITNFRTQWTGVTKGYRTMAAAADMKFLETKGNNVFGGGISIISDKAGDLDFRTNTVNLTFSILKALNRKGTHFVSLGIQNSFTNTSINYAKIIARDAEPAIMEGALNTLNYWDLSAGMGWFYTFNRRSSVYLGASLFHINEPYVSVFDDPNTDAFVYRKYIIHGGGDFDLGSSMSLKPSFIFVDQGPHREITTGTFWKYSKGSRTSRSNNNLAAIYFGGWIRWYLEKDLFGSDAVIATLRLDYKRTFFTFSYDINISKYSRVSYGRGGPEFSILSTLDFKNQRKRTSKVKCPSFYY